MKKFLFLVFAAATGGMPAPQSATAIPDRVGFFVAGNAFLEDNGVNLEDHALSAEAWSGSGLKGKWQRDADEDQRSLQAYLLESSAVVFGVQASQVRLLKRAEDPQSFLIRFQADGEHLADGGEVLKILRKNVEAYTGKRPVDGKGLSCRFVYKDFDITLAESGPDSVLLSIRRLPA